MNELEQKMVDYFKEVVLPELLKKGTGHADMNVHVVVREIVCAMSSELLRSGEKGVFDKVSTQLHIAKNTYYGYSSRPHDNKK